MPETGQMRDSIIEGEYDSTPMSELLAEVWAAYQLTGEPRLLTGSGVRDFDGLTGLDSGVNLNLLAERHGRPVVVRVYFPRVTSRRLADLQRVRGLLRDAGVPIPTLISTTDGRPWLPYDGRLVEVEEYVAHDAHMDTWTRLDAGMPLLGRIHTTLAGVDAAAETRYLDFANAVDATDALATTARGIARIRLWRDSVSGGVQRMCDEAEELAELVAAAETASPPTHRQLVHTATSGTTTCCSVPGMSPRSSTSTSSGTVHVSMIWPSPSFSPT
jgi:homoserine kinase type II